MCSVKRSLLPRKDKPSRGHILQVLYHVLHVYPRSISNHTTLYQVGSVCRLGRLHAPIPKFVGEVWGIILGTPDTRDLR